jgi:hypothetical protein
MVQRQSQAFDVNTGDTPAVQSAAGNRATPNVAKFAPGRAAQVQVDDTLSSVVGVLAKNMQTTAINKMNRTLEMEYLEGAAAAQRGEVEEMLETNPITKDWKVGGYRDTVAKLKSADIDSRLAIDMKTLREQEPAKFQEYLTQKRSELEPYIPGMTAEAKKGFLAQRLTWERQAITTHGAQHFGFILERKQQVLTNSMRVQADNLTKLRNDSLGNAVVGTAYLTATDAIIGQAYKDIIQEPMWDDKKRGDLVYELAHNMLSSENNHMLVYDKLKNTMVPMRDGTSRSMLSLVPADKLDKLSTDYTQAKNNVEGVRMEQSNRELAMIEARIDDPLGTQFPAADELTELIAARQTMDPKFNSKQLWENYAKASIKRERQGIAERSYAIGDVTNLRRQGMDETDGLRSTMAAWTQRGVPPEQQAAQLLDIGMNHGMPSALGELGKRMSGTIMNLGVPDRPVDAGAMAELGKYLTALERGSVAGRRDLISELTTNMPEEAARKVNHYLAKYAQGGRTPQQAWEEANNAIVQMAGKTNQEKAAMAMTTASERNAMVQGFQPLGWASGLWDGVARFVPRLGRDAEATFAASPVVSPLTPADVESAISVNMRTAYMDEMTRVANGDPNLSGPGLDRQVKRNLANRAIPVDAGVLFMPANMSLGVLTGGDAAVDKGRVGRAIDSLYPPSKKGGYVLWSALASGTVTGVDYDSSGARTGLVRNIDPNSVKAKLDEMNADEQRTANTIYGNGKQYKDQQSGAVVNYNGRNDAAVRGSWMLGLRDDLTRHEGVRDTPYDDKTGKPLAAGEAATGKATVGVGVAEHNRQFYPNLKPGERATQAMIDESFRGASNAAANAAVKVSQQYRLQNNEQAFRLLGSMAYHGGTGFAKDPAVQEMLAAATTGQEVTAMQALKQTKQYAAAGAQRKTYYETMLRGITRR